MKIISFEKKKMKLLTKEKKESNAEICYICKEKFENRYVKDKKYFKIRDHCHYIREFSGATDSIRNLKCSKPKKNSIAFHNGPNYDYHFIIKEQKNSSKNLLVQEKTLKNT